MGGATPTQTRTMQAQHEIHGNPRTDSAKKRAIWRALRHYFLQGWTRYHGHLIQQDSRLSAYFPKEAIATVRELFANKRKWWYQQDPLLQFRRNDHQVHLPTVPKQRVLSYGRAGTLRLLTYNCRSLGISNARLVEIAEDLHTRGIHAAAIQGTCWKHTSHRSEWKLHTRNGKPIYHCISWGKGAQDPHAGTLLLLHVDRFVASHIVERFDPAKRWAGRIGGIRYIDRANKHPADHTFITAYAPQESASEIDRQLFFTELQLLLHGLPRRTNTWLMGDFNAHVGPDSHFRSVGPCNAEVTNDNGIMLGHLCDSAGLSLANTFHPAGSTWWSANRESSHRIDYVAIQHSFRRRLKLCHVNKLLGRRWQTSTTPDHYPVEVLVGLKAGWPPRRPQRTPQQWNRQALLSACTDPVLAAPFLRDVADSLTQHHDEFTSSKSLQEQWTSVNDTLHGIAMKHFSKHPEQRNSKIQPQTFAILQQRRDATQTFMHARQCLTLAGCNQRVPHLLRVIVLGWRVVKLMAQARQAVKDDLRAWERQLECNLREAMRANNHREAWSVSRQLAGRNFRKHGERQPPPAKSISKASWLQHFRQVQNAVECVGSAGFVPDPSPDYRIFFEGEEGCNSIAAAARRMPRDRATPRGSLPIELWSLIMQGQTGLMIMPYLELFQAMGINPSLWCEGHGCPIPKPGGDPTPNGMRVINLLDPLGKAFYKAAFQSHADTRACHQYGYSAKCSRRDAILQVTTLLQRLRMARMCTAANLYDLTKAFDMLSSQSVLQDLQQHQPFCPTIVAMLEDMQQRLLIHLPLSSGGSLHVHVRDGVLQGGGTGPRLFRRVYDTVVGDWQQRTTPEACLTRVSYEDSVLDLSTSAYADDLLRVEAADTADGIEAATVEHTRDLQNDLQPHRLQLNLRKCESLVSIRGRGSYVAARSLFSGAWKGLPLKPSVKYLGTHLQPFDSAKLEVTMRIAAARSAFAMFSKFLRRASVPLRRKILVFNAVVNEALLSVLEVRVLTGSDYQRLEAARGLLLRRLFGRHGYGKVADDQAPHSVPLSLLRQVCGLAEVEVELRVRRLLWLRSSLLAEQAGDTRLELASLFGRLEWQLTSPVDAEGGLTSVAPTFLHVLDRDIRQVMAQWDGFRPGWKHAFLAVGVSTIRSLRGASIQRHQQHDFPMIPGSRAQDGSNPMPDHAQDLTKPGDNAVMQTQFVDNPAEFVRSMRVLSDGTIPDIDAGLTSEHWRDGVYCGQCAAGPFHSMKTFASHIYRKHRVRHSLQDTACPHCGRQFTSVSACRRHVLHQSCEKSVVNHGHAGAVAGLRECSRSTPECPAAAGSSRHPERRPPQLQHPSHGIAGIHGSSAGRQQLACCHSSSKAAASIRPSWQNQRPFGRSSAAALQATSYRDEDRQPARQGAPRLRSLELPHVFAAQRARTGEGAASSHDIMESSHSGQGRSSARASSLDSRRNSGTGLVARRVEPWQA